MHPGHSSVQMAPYRTLYHIGHTSAIVSTSTRIAVEVDDVICVVRSFCHWPECPTAMNETPKRAHWPTQRPTQPTNLTEPIARRCRLGRPFGAAPVVVWPRVQQQQKCGQKPKKTITKKRQSTDCARQNNTKQTNELKTNKRNGRRARVFDATIPTDFSVLSVRVNGRNCTDRTQERVCVCAYLCGESVKKKHSRSEN